LPAKIHAAALSDTGLVRSNNEDSFAFDPDNDLYVVCDGMGGMAAGEVASKIACTTTIDVFAAQSPGLPLDVRLSTAIHAANAAVFEASHHAAQHGMGTTLVAAAIAGSKLIIANVGDSRAYLIDNGDCGQITIDHSYINELIRNGTLNVETAASADLEAIQSIITRAIGIEAEVEPDIFTVDLHPGAAVLLTTDGLTRHVQAQEIAAVFAAVEPNLVCASLIQLAKERGGHDNITCMLLVCLPA